ncbi:MAG: hypothetical protein H6Q30_2817, partial [Bacteroidetes bacterium]|nr:hypothetical protein [Bacteroidota bacterium]
RKPQVVGSSPTSSSYEKPQAVLWGFMVFVVVGSRPTPEAWDEARPVRWTGRQPRPPAQILVVLATSPGRGSLEKWE